MKVRLPSISRKTLLLSAIPYLYLLLLLFQIDGSLATDLGRQIKMGEIIYHCSCVPQVNTFSLTNPDAPTINYSWLSELIYFLLVTKFGVLSLLYLKFILVIVTFTIIYLPAIKKGATFASVILSLYALAIISGRLNVRPELFSYFFIALFLLLFGLYKRKQEMRFLWFIPPLLIIWTNMHIYFIIGVLLFFFFLIEQIILHKKLTLQFIILTSCVLLAPLINPAFMQGAFYPFTIWHNYGYKIIENYPPLIFVGNYSFSVGICIIILFELLSCFALTGIFVFPKKANISEKLNTLLGIGIGQLLFRGMALFSFLSLSFLIKEYEFIQHHAAVSFKKKFGNTIKTSVIVLFSLLLIYQILSIQYFPGFGFAYEPSAEEGVDFFLKNNLHGAIFNNFSTGNYLIYRLYPKQHVFLDGRPEAYPATFFTRYSSMLSNNDYFNQQANKYAINVVFFGLADNPQQTRMFLLKLTQDKKWEPVFWNGKVVIFVRNNPDNAKLISTNRNVKDVLLKSLTK